MAMKRKIQKSEGYDTIYLTQAFDEFIFEKEAVNLAPATISNYRTTFDIMCEFFEFNTETEVDEITLSYIIKWVRTMKLEGYKPTTINHYLRDTRTFLYWCMEREYITEPYKIQLIKGQEEAPKHFSDDDLEKLLEKPKRSDSFIQWRTWAIVNWVLGTGNRAATICDVRLSDINYAHREITLGHTKNKKAQVIPLSSSLNTALKEYIRMWRSDAPLDGFLFPNIGEEQMTTNALRQAFGRYCKKRDVEQTNIHGLRHNFAKGWVQNNGNMFALQKILGHSSLDMTRRYVKLYSEDLKDDFDKFNPLDTIKRSSKRKQAVKKSEFEY